MISAVFLCLTLRGGVRGCSCRVAPSSIRLVDNEQFQFGLALKPTKKNPFTKIIDGFKKIYVTKWHGFEPLQMCVATLMIEGTKEEVAIP